MYPISLNHEEEPSMTDSTLITLLASAALGWAARHFNLIAPKVQPSDIPPLPSGIGHGQIAEWLARTALQLAKEMLAAQGDQPPNPAK
jgi:hypothetical protein